MNNQWKSIWNKKGLDSIDLSRDEFDVFRDLKKANGYDVSVHDEQAYFKNFYREWMEMYRQLTEIAGNNIHSIYEVGCGSGVNLYLFKNRIPNAVLGGIDYSEGLVKLARNVTGCEDIVCSSAENMDTETHYDLVMGGAIFQYFGDRDYAEDVLNKMIHKSEKIVYISELHDIELEEEWLAYRRKSMENYDQIYEGLGKMFYSREWISDIARENGKQIVFTKRDNPEYWNSRYEFNCFIF